MLKTKEFADICATTKRTLIHYDRIGLLKPKRRRGVFRLYEPRQALIFQKIVLLKSFGLKLSEIKVYIRRSDLLLPLFKQKAKDLTKQKNLLEKHIQKANEFIDSLEHNKLLITPQVKTIEPFWFYSLPKEGRYVDIANHQKELFTLVKDKSFTRNGMTIFYNRDYSPDNANMVTAVTMGRKKPQYINGLTIGQIPLHKSLSYTHVGTYSYMSYIWQFLEKYVKDNKIKEHPTLSCREIYIKGSLAGFAEEDLVTELQIPIL